MANPNPYKARLAKRRKARKQRKPLDLDDARNIASEMLEALGDRNLTLMEAGGGSTAELCKLSHAVAAVLGAHKTLMEADALSEIPELKEQIAELREERRATQIRA